MKIISRTVDILFLILLSLFTTILTNNSYVYARPLIVSKSSKGNELSVRIVKNALSSRFNTIVLSDGIIKTRRTRELKKITLPKGNHLRDLNIVSGVVLPSDKHKLSGGPLELSYQILPKTNRIIISGYFRDGDKTYQIVQRGLGVVLRIDNLSRITTCAGEVLPDGSNGAIFKRQIEPAVISHDQAEQDVIIDIALIYTPQAVAYLGGESYIALNAASAVEGVNQAYQRSGIVHRLRLAHVATTTSSESVDLQSDLDRVALSGDGFFDEVQAIRDSVNADLVVLMVSRDDSRACGIAYLLRPHLDISSEAFGYSVTAVPCLPFDTLAHEVAHNMGSAHDKDNHASPGFEAFSYSYGYRFNVDGSPPYRTIMAYDPGTRISYFSNPLIEYLGVSIGSKTADNALSMNNTAPYVAAFRPVDAIPFLVTPSIASPPPQPTATPEVDINLLPNSVIKLKAVTNRKGYCVISGTVLNQVNASIPNLEVVAIKGRNLAKTVSKLKRTNKVGTISLTTKLKRRAMIGLYFPTTNGVTTPIKCKAKRS